MAFIGDAINQEYVTVTPSATPTFDLSQGNILSHTAAAAITGITLSNPGPAGSKYTLLLRYSGVYAVAGWPATVNWKGGAAPTFTSAADKMDVVVLLWDGTNYYADSVLDFATT
jgi:hypothetical protein